MVFKNYYKILDLETSRVSIEEIKAAYRQAAKKYHPDLNVGDELAEERIKDINEAYKILSKPSTKRKYDRVWNSKFAKGEKFASKGKVTLVNMLLGDNFEEKTKKQDAIKGENIETQISVNLEEAFNGQDKKIALKTENGKEKIITVTIPKGFKNGGKIRLVGQGKAGLNGGNNGDLFIKINIKDNSKFRLVGSDIYTDLLLTPWEAALGARVTVKSIDDETKVYIPQGIQSGEKIRIANKGYQINEGKRGDLVAEVKVVVPRELTEKEKEIYMKLNEISKFNPRV